MSTSTLARPAVQAPAPSAREMALNLRLLAADLAQAVRDLDDGHLAGLAQRLERHRGVLAGLADEIEPGPGEGRPA